MRSFPKEGKKVKQPEPTAAPEKATPTKSPPTEPTDPPKKPTTTKKPAKVEKPVTVTDKPQAPEKKMKESAPTATQKKETTTKPPKEIKEQKVVKPNMEKKGPKQPTGDEKAKMAEVPIPSQKTAKPQETMPDIDSSSEAKKLVAEKNNVVAYFCEYNLPFLGMLLYLNIQPLSTLP